MTYERYFAALVRASKAITADIFPERLKISNWNLESNFTPTNFLNGADIDFHLSGGDARKSEFSP